MAVRAIDLERDREAERRARVDLAAVHRLAHRFGWNDNIYNHLTYTVPGHPNQFLVKAHGYLMSEITASQSDRRGHRGQHGERRRRSRDDRAAHPRRNPHAGAARNLRAASAPSLFHLAHLPRGQPARNGEPGLSALPRSHRLRRRVRGARHGARRRGTHGAGHRQPAGGDAREPRHHHGGADGGAGIHGHLLPGTLLRRLPPGGLLRRDSPAGRGTTWRNAPRKRWRT